MCEDYLDLFCSVRLRIIIFLVFVVNIKHKRNYASAAIFVNS